MTVSAEKEVFLWSFGWKMTEQCQPQSLNIDEYTFDFVDCLYISSFSWYVDCRTLTFVLLFLSFSFFFIFEQAFHDQREGLPKSLTRNRSFGFSL